MLCLPGAFWHYDVWKDYIDSLTPSIFYDGVNDCTWNGGRANVSSNLWNDEIVNEYTKRGHTIALTFSNAYIDFSDDVGKILLSKLDNISGYVILKNYLLARYIRIHHPNIRLIYSITGVQEEYSSDFYRKILTWCDYVVPRWHHIYQIAKDFCLIKDRFEIMINHSCPSQCPYWNEHYNNVDVANSHHKTYDNYDNELITCMINEKLTDTIEIDIRKRLKYAMQLGYTRFKLAGREFTKEKLRKQIEEILQ